MRCAARALLLLAVASCNEITTELDPEGDGRPLELTYMTAAVFAPSCGQAQCHSSFRRAGDLVFDNPDDVRHSLHKPGGFYNLLQFTSDQYDPAWTGYNDELHNEPNLIVWVTEIDPFAAGIGRMPFDQPLAKRDIELLIAWIRSPNQPPGSGAAGAQCDPDRYNAQACNEDQLHECTPDGNFGALIKTCEGGCTVAEDRNGTFRVQCD